MFKVCIKCKEEKSLEMFSKDKKNKFDGTYGNESWKN